MDSVAKSYPHVVGIDTHAANHHLAIVHGPTAELVADRGFPATGAGIARALAWVARRTGGQVGAVLVVIEGIGSYGAKIAAAATAAGYRVAEAPRVERAQRYGRGKSDAIDAQLIATAALSVPVDRLRQARRAEGTIGALSVLSSHRRQLTEQKTRYINQLTALVRSHDLGIEATARLSKAKIRQIAAWRPRTGQDPALATARGVAIRTAKAIADLERELADNTADLLQLVTQTTGGPELLAQRGVGPVTAAAILTAYSHPGRLQSEAAFAALAGVNPIPASSGKTHRHRLNRGGDRQLNAALYTITLCLLSTNPQTQAYRDRLMTGPNPKTKKEAIRIIKRRLARKLYRLLNRAHAPQRTTHAALPAAA